MRLSAFRFMLQCPSKSGAMLALSIGTLALPWAWQAQAGSKFTTFHPHGSIATYATGINTSGTIAGSYQDTGYRYHGFARSPDGTITAFDPEGSVDTQAVGINRGGLIAGSYATGNDFSHAFVRSPDGTFTTIPYGATEASAIDNDGAVTGTSSLLRLGFLWTPDGHVAFFAAPGAANGTEPKSINDSGVIAGLYYDSDEFAHGFIRAAAGTITVFNVPGSAATFPASINADGAIAGMYSDDTFTIHGFVRNPAGSIATFDPEGSMYTAPQSINAKGEVTGFFIDARYVDHGFVRTPDGKLTVFDVPGGTSTSATALNGEDAVVGGYIVGRAAHGFLRSP
jgi:uncharacterized membrane protein